MSFLFTTAAAAFLIAPTSYGASDLAPLVTAGAAAAFAYLWYGIPLIRAIRNRR